ncbi:MAG: hypothetical protein MPJ50_15240 [Pirellulales bacterium]|nr:hypothetical protein [Pirellulales bacterium]
MKRFAIAGAVLFAGCVHMLVEANEWQQPAARQVPQGKTTLLRESPKVFATYWGAGLAEREFLLQVEGEPAPQTWTLAEDAEVKVHGWWGRLDQLTAGDRIWVWSSLDRSGNRSNVVLLADEPSEQGIHAMPYRLASVDVEQRSVRFERTIGRRQEQETRELTLSDTLQVKHVDEHFEFSHTGAGKDAATRLKIGDSAILQTAGDSLRLVWSERGFDNATAAQLDFMRDRWNQQGLPGTVSIAHSLVGEAEIILDHEAMRWGRYLKPGDKVRVAHEDPIDAVVHDVQPWHEKTRVMLFAVQGRDLTDLTAGQRVSLLVPEPPAEVQASTRPTDIGRLRDREQRVQWFLASTYCACSIDGDGCTGMFYTLASCNPGTCGMPNRFRKIVEPLIDQGKSDEEILRTLETTLGPACLKQHLLK